MKQAVQTARGESASLSLTLAEVACAGGWVGRLDIDGRTSTARISSAMVTGTPLRVCICAGREHGCGSCIAVPNGGVDPGPTMRSFLPRWRDGG